jgi:hypothetical protein
MSTVATVIDRTVRQLMSGTVEERNKVVSAITATDTSISFQYDLGGMRPGGVIQIDAELMYIWEISSGSKSVTVERGWNGTTAATHVASSIAIVDPMFPNVVSTYAPVCPLTEVTAPGLELVTVTAPVAPLTEIPVPATSDVTPEFVNVTAPVDPLTEIPEPATALDTPVTAAVFCTVASPNVIPLSPVFVPILFYSFYLKFIVFFISSTSLASSLIASTSNGAVFSYQIVKYLSSIGAVVTISGRIFWTSCADNPTSLFTL